MAQTNLELLISANNQLSSGLKSAERDVDAFSRKVDRSMGLQGQVKDINRGIRDMSQFVRVLALAEAGAKGVKAAFDLTGLAINVATGNLSKAEQSVAKLRESMLALPYGIGTAFGVGLMIGNYFSGEQRDVDQINADIKQIQDRMAGFAAPVVAAKREVDTLTKSMERLREAARLGMFEGADREVEQVNIAFEKLQEGVDKARKAIFLDDGSFRNQSAALVQAAERVAAMEVEAEREKQRQISEIRAKAQRDEEQARINNARKVANLEADVQIQTLRLAGRMREAQEMEIVDRFRQQLMNATTDAERTMLTRLRDLHIAQLAAPDAQRLRDQARQLSPVIDGRGITGVQQEFRERGQLTQITRKAAEAQIEMAKTTRENQATLSDILRVLMQTGSVIPASILN